MEKSLVYTRGRFFEYLPKGILILLVSFVSACTKGQKTYSMDQILESIIYKTRDHKEVLAELERCKKECSIDEKDLAGEITSTVLPIVASYESMSQRAPELNDVFLKALRVYEDDKDPANYLSAVKAAILHAQQKQMLKESHEDFVKSLIGSLETYVSKQGQSKEAYAQLSRLHAGFDQKDHLEKALKYSEKCLRLDKEYSPCREAHSMAKNRYSIPQCEGKRISAEFKIALGDKVETRSPETLSFKKLLFTLGKEKAIPLTQLAKKIRLIGEGGRGMLDIELSESGSDQLQKYSSNKEGRALLFTLNNEILGVIRVEAEPLKAYYFSVEVPDSKDPNAFFNEFCEQVQ